MRCPKRATWRSRGGHDGDVDTARACAVLQVDAAGSLEDLRSAHRAAIRRAHPDAGGSNAQAALVNEAFALLRDAIARRSAAGAGARGSAASRPRPSGRPVSSFDRFSAGRGTSSAGTGGGSAVSAGSAKAGGLDPADLLLRIAEAAHHIGEVVMVDPDAGIVEVVVGNTAGSSTGRSAITGAGQLLVQVGAAAEAGDATSSGTGPPAADDGVPVAFTLEPLGTLPAPPIHEVAAALMSRVHPR